MSDPDRTIRDIGPQDIQAITRIYNHYIQHSTSTFEEQLVTEKQIEERVRKVTDSFPISYPWLVATEKGDVVGYAYASPWKERSAYRFACETSVYMDSTSHSRGTGSLLYRELLAQLASLGITTAIGVITLPNPRSIKLHERIGFQQVGHLHKVGFKFGEWHDTCYWQKQL
ncbi:N-acetyltransferase family protein [Sansalvadorimonas sp. 2012CJ34-2]|uniref:N-acetyltransferase family protein n=1 Tax=Parendozoicomonas callyspongiae TaxID=2942213 RepID=A0ABT0PJR0_9GAMM|nr:GNAT family N-acetyltransferase [Sansalvadorimonas sp. 2012CJ34-2]MCL6271211.1 N-acetyltransferase family protein [Sansalvadorimonas sp. 2012CJ34-2]